MFAWILCIQTLRRFLVLATCLGLALVHVPTKAVAEGEGGGRETDVNSVQRPKKVKRQKKPKVEKAKSRKKARNQTSAKSKTTAKSRKTKSKNAASARQAKQTPRPRVTAARKPAKKAATRVVRRRTVVASGQPPAGETRFLNDQIIVRYFLDANQRQMDDVVRRLDLRHLNGRTFGLAGITAHLYQITNGATVTDVIAALETDPTVASAQPNYLYTLQQNAASSGFVDSQYALAKFSIGKVHAVTRGRLVSVAVIDSGIDSKHPELSATAIETLDATDLATIVAHTHGTSIAGVIASRGVLVGIAPDVNLIGVRAFTVDKNSGATRSTSWQIARALDLSHEAGARVINMSFAGARDPLVGKSIAGAQSRGLIAIAAAGNNGPDSKPAFPAAYSGVIAVTATDENDAVYGKANQGAYVQIAAPGVGILAPVPNGGYEISSGTSLAAAHVSGLVALMLSQKGTLTSEQIQSILEKTATDLGLPGRDVVFGSGLPDANAAVGAAGS